jgi:hypothetical protein
MFLLVEQQICRLEVAMDDAAVVGVLEGVAHGDANPGYLAPTEAAAGRQLVLQAAAVDQLHYIEQVAVFFAIAVKLHDVRMQQALERLDFNLEALAEALVIGQVRRKHFDGRPLAGGVVHADIDRPHAAAAERFFQAIRAKAFEWHATIVGNPRRALQDCGILTNSATCATPIR